MPSCARSSSTNSNDQAGKQEQGLHLLSLKVKVIEMVEDEDNLFLVEALESYKDEINQGDTISVAADSTKVSDILGTYQEHNSFRIYFPKIDDTSDGISVTCLDVVQYDSSGEIIQQAERQWSECEPVNWKQRIRWNGQYRQISIELVRVS